jgi:hypothetical protein
MDPYPQESEDFCENTVIKYDVLTFHSWRNPGDAVFLVEQWRDYAPMVVPAWQRYNAETWF